MQDVVTQQRPPRGRIEEERARRRRRDDLGFGRHRTLAIAGDLDPRYEYRWISEDPGRVHALTVSDDWDRVTQSQLGDRADKEKAVGDGVERIVDRVTGKRAILVRKLKEFYVEDKRKEQAQVDELDTMIKRGVVPEKSGQESLKGPNAYVPSGGIVISDGRRA